MTAIDVKISFDFPAGFEISKLMREMQSIRTLLRDLFGVRNTRIEFTVSNL